MKKFLKVFLISLCSLILLVVIVACIALWIVFTPNKLTPIVRSQADKYIACQSEVGQVELTFFSTFPHFELKIDQVTLIHPMPGAPCDTLLDVDLVEATVDIAALWKEKDLMLSNIRLSNGTICAYIDSLGNANFDVFPSDTLSEDTTQMELPFGLIDVTGIELNNINILYVDDLSKTNAEVTGFSAKIAGSMQKQESIRVDLDMLPFDISFTNFPAKLKAEIRNLSGKVAGSLDEDLLHADIGIKPFQISFEQDGQSYITDQSLGFDVLLDVVLSKRFVQFQNLSMSVNDLVLGLQGSVGMDTVHNDIITDISYKLDSWRIKDVLTLVPASFSSYLDGIDADGKFSSEGKITGVFNDSVMPLVDVHLLLEDGNVKYSKLPFPLKNIQGDINLYTDFRDDATSYVRINNLNAQTPKSAIKTAGIVNRLFSDVRINLTTNTNLNLAEFKPFLPADMKVDMNGNVTGDIKSNFTLSQIEKMQLDKMKLSGSLLLSGIAVDYDSISVRTDRSLIDFALPNQHAKTRNTTFASANIVSNSLIAGMIDGFDANLQNALIEIETSDVRDTTQIPAIRFVLKSEKLNAALDTIHISVANPSAELSVSPQRRNAEKPRFRVVYSSDALKADMGQHAADVEKLAISANVTYNKDEEDIFLKFMPRGSFNLQKGKVSTSMLAYPVEIPAVKMEFTPRQFVVDEAAIKIDNSDFHLSGKLDNILPYFRGDSILRGKFDFTSGFTDIDKLMALTSGIGDKNDKQIEQEIKSTDTAGDSFSGPYMVPKGMDILLHTDIKQADFNGAPIRDIKGDVYVNDGILVLDGLSLTAPAADMNLTAMYETPRKNHLAVKLILQMLDIEISELLSMVPGLDSIMPMLRSFGGKAEFHVAAETNLDSLYNLKMSTLRAASSIRGEDLVLMDGETFTKIAKTLRFNKKAENKVDSLTAEFTIFRNEIDVFPFLVVMDKYKAVVGGRHNLDMSFDYNISIVQSPLPFRLAVNVSGTPDKLKFRPGRSKYPDFYRPVYRREVPNKELELRQMIRESLIKKDAVEQ